MSAVYYLRMDGKIRGPFAADQLTHLLARGIICHPVDASTDRRNWTSLQAILGMIGQTSELSLEFAEPTPRSTRTVPPPVPIPRRNPTGASSVHQQETHLRLQSELPTSQDISPLPLLEPIEEEPDYEIHLDAPASESPNDTGADWFGDVDFGNMSDDV